MAGFQKFPVPKYLYIDFWNYNKKWLGDTFFISLGGMLTFLSLHRFLASRIVIIYLIFREQMKELATLLIPHTKLHLKSSNSDHYLIINLSFKFILLMDFLYL